MNPASPTPRVSVVIPAYNQASYLGDAVRSVLGQTYRDFEIILVDDGSTDETSQLAQGFGESIRYLYQDNQGLAGARNTGITHARGDLVALLDSDDAWMPDYLEKMVALADAHPEGNVFYCAVSYIDADGRDLPQRPEAISLPPEAMYPTLLRYNFLVPSTILMRREAVEAVGCFDPDFRRIQDWELWLRMLQANYRIFGIPDRLVRYRLHETSLSTDPSGGQAAVRAMVEKLFGPEDGSLNAWPAEKRRAYGGAYRYHTLTALQYQGDWQAAAAYLRLALDYDPGLIRDGKFFYELALGAQPLGRRGARARLDLEANAARLLEAVSAAASGLDRPAARQALASAGCALGQVAYHAGRPDLSRRFLLNSVRWQPELLAHREVLGMLLRTLVGPAALKRLRQFKNPAGSRS